MALYIRSGIVFFLLVQPAATDNGVTNGISDVCLNCLRRVQPTPEEGCVDNPTIADAKLCGPYKISEGFYTDCKAFMEVPVPDGWNTWQKCYESQACSMECVRAYHNHYTPNCMAAKPDSSAELVCADYGQIHNKGASTCGNELLVATEFIYNMTLKCGCETVFGNRAECLQPTQPPDYRGFVTKENFIGAIVGVCCAAVVVIAIVIAVAAYFNYKKSQANINRAERGRVVSQKLRPFDGRSKTASPVLPAVNKTTTKEAETVQMESHPADHPDNGYQNLRLSPAMVKPSHLDTSGSVSNGDNVRAPIPAPR